MSKRGQDVLLGALIGLMFGGVLGLLAAGAYVAWRFGVALNRIGLWTYFEMLPGIEYAFVPGDYRTGALIGLTVVGAAMIGGIALSWRPPLDSHGSARWAEPGELRREKLLARRVEKVSGPIWAKLGRPWSFRPYLSSGEIVHSLVAAPTGAGKGVGIVIPTLLTYPGSLVVLDVKGENYCETARRRHLMGNRVFKFAPYARDRRGHRYNPLDQVAATPERRRYGAALKVANALLVPIHGNESWIGGGREIVAAAIVTAVESGQATMAAVYDLLTSPAGTDNELLATLAAMTKSGEARGVFHKYAAKDQKVVSGYMSILNEGGLRIFLEPDVRDATAASDFDIRSFRADPASLYLCVTQTDIGQIGPLLRVMIGQMCAAIQENKRGPEDRFDVLFVLDEFASLGRSDELSTAITTLRSEGGHLMLIVQGLSNLFGPYGNVGANNFLTNCDLQLFMAPQDLETPRYLAEMIGDTTRQRRGKTWSPGKFDPASITEKPEGTRLIRPEQIRLIGKEKVIALIKGQHPVLTHRVTWFKDRLLKRLHKAQEKIDFAAFEPAEMPETPRSGKITWSTDARPAAPKDKAEAAPKIIEAEDQAGGAKGKPGEEEPPAKVLVFRKDLSGSDDQARKLDRMLKKQDGVLDEIEAELDAYAEVRNNLLKNKK